MIFSITAIPPIKKPAACSAVLVLLFLFTACQKDPAILQREDSQLAFYNASHVLKQAMQNASGQRGVPILVNTSEVEEITNLSVMFEGGASRQLAFPSINEDPLPWAEYMRITPGTQTIRFLGVDSTVLAETQLETRSQAPGRLFLSDSLGAYHTFYLQDEGRAAARQVRLRVTHLGPDAGELQLVINNEPVTLAKPLAYRSATEMISRSIPENQVDTLLRLQVIKPGAPGEQGEIIGRTNLALKPGETAHVVIYGYYNNASYEDAATGETVNISPDFRVHAFKYN